jgi:DNA-directed RNA polymerase I, II, and III subunit RPABC2
MSYKRSGGSSYFGRGGAGSDDDEDEDVKVMKEGESDSDADETVSVISDDGAPILDEDEEGADAANEGATSDVEEEGEGDVEEGDQDGEDVVKPEGEGEGDEDEDEADDNDSDMTDAYESDEDMESGEIDETKPVKRVPRQKVATTIDAAAIMGGPSSNPGIQALLDDTIDSDEEADGEDESYLQKFNTEIKKNYVVDNHPECVIQNYHEIVALSVVVRDKYNNVIDGLHRTCPYLSKFEKTRVLGQRAMQINAGAPAFIKVPENIVDGYLIAEMELSEKKIPFIIRRPLPNGGSEYWKLSDLEDILF